MAAFKCANSMCETIAINLLMINVFCVSLSINFDVIPVYWLKYILFFVIIIIVVYFSNLQSNYESDFIYIILVIAAEEVNFCCFSY